MIYEFVRPLIKISSAISYLHQQTVNLFYNVVARIHYIGVFTIKVGVVAGLYLLHPHGFFWIGTFTFFFFDQQFKEIDQAVKQLFSKIIYNKDFPFYIRLPIFFTAIVIVVYDHPDWMTLFSFLCAGKIGSSLRQMIREDNRENFLIN